MKIEAEMKVNIKNEADAERAAGEFLEQIGDRRVIAFHAPMGAGKTTFTAAIVRRLGMADEATSPTFSIINEYAPGPGAADSRPVYHFDFYRIDDPAEAADLGLDDYFYSGSLCLIEWPENVEAFLPEETLHVNITVNPDGSRTITELS